MLETVIILVVIVQLIQSLGDYFARKRSLKAVLVGSIVLWLVCITTQVWPTGLQQESVLKIGIIAGAQQKILQVAQRVAEKDYHLKLKIIVFDDYVLPNTVLNTGNIDANIFQHVPYLDAQIKARGYKLTPIAKTFVFPFGFYSRKIKTLAALPNNAIVAIPNDPSNEGRALLLLQKAGLITLKKGSGLFPTPDSIVSNPKHLQFRIMAAAQLPRVLKDATLVALTNDFVGPAGFTVKQALVKEGPDSPYANVIVVRTVDQRNPLFKELIKVMHSKPVLDETMKLFPDGAAIQAWK